MSIGLLVLVSNCLSVCRYYVREVADIFVVGQEYPKVEVPAPNSKIANKFQKELIQVKLP